MSKQQQEGNVFCIEDIDVRIHKGDKWEREKYIFLLIVSSVSCYWFMTQQAFILKRKRLKYQFIIFCSSGNWNVGIFVSELIHKGDKVLCP